MSVVKQIKQALYPGFYKKEHVPRGSVNYLLSRRKGLGRYSVICIDKPVLADVNEVVVEAKKTVMKSLLAFPLFGEVGTFIIINTNQNISEVDSAKINVDLTAVFKSVIVQGVCIISSQNRHPVYRLSTWGTTTFGDATQVMRIIKQEMKV